MASKTGDCSLTKEDRAILLIDLHKSGDVSTSTSTTTTTTASSKSNLLPESIQKELADAVAVVTTTSSPNGISNNNGNGPQQQQQQQQQQGDDVDVGTGCLCCGEDDDHANILLCEGCNAEYHTYCLDPPLRAVPTGDWYCCKYFVVEYHLLGRTVDFFDGRCSSSSS
jgi:hypothetical protein